MSELNNRLFDVFSNNQFDYNLWEKLLEEYEIDDVLAQIADEIYNQKRIQMDRVVRDLKDVPSFKLRMKSVKTVGTFYFRMYNGGVEKVISLLVEIWINQGYNVVLFTDSEPSKDDYILPAEVQRVILPSLKENPNKVDFLIRARAWKELIAKYSVDIMVYHAWLNEFFVFDQLAIKSIGIPLIVQAHGSSTTGLTCIKYNISYLTATQENSYSMCDTIVTLSSVDNVWWASLGIPCKTVYNPPSYALDKVCAAPLDEKIVLWVGRFSNEKQIYDALKAIKIVHETVPDVQLWILGKGETEQATQDVENYLDENEMSEYVLLKGFQTCVQSFYQKAALTLMTSKFEGFPMVAIESALSGVPLVLYELPNLEIVRKSSGVTVAPQGNIKALAARITELLQDDGLRKEKGKRIRNDAMQMYSTDLGKQWQEIFESSLSAKATNLPKYQRDEASVAIIISMQHIRANFLNFHDVYCEHDEWVKHLERDIVTLNNGIRDLSCQLEETKKEYRILKEQSLFNFCRKRARQYLKRLYNKMKRKKSLGKVFNIMRRLKATANL